MQQAATLFGDHLARVRALHALYQSLRANTTAAVDLSDLLRAEIVLAVSAFDAFVHDLVLAGMRDTQAGRRSPTDAFRRFRVTLASVDEALAAPGGTDWLDEAVRQAHGHLSFQHPDKVAEAIRLISSVELWNAVGHSLGTDPKAIKAALITVVDRRNKIAHEADMDPLNPGTRWPIDEPLTVAAVDNLERIGNAIYSVV